MMTMPKQVWLAATLPLCLAACTVMPNGPSAMVLPGSGKSFDQFRSDDFSCRNFAQSQIGGATAEQVSSESGVRSAALGTAIGAVAGAAIGGSHGAGVGAGTGLAFGALEGSNAGQRSGSSLQRRYDVAYQQCMYADGHKIPVSGRMVSQVPSGAAVPPPDALPPPD